ncbi:MAG: SUMF1/EgtB/PvdO family nonheme iron enzyme [Verrucomicrobiae bacterium]|nr:SUMF1/EgtB/PvdO family nonheme iron enzyme [Verrucomicrobiae bacterium]
MRLSTIALVALGLVPAGARAVTIELVNVGDPGNGFDPLNTNLVAGIGSVASVYSIGRFEVKNSQYAEFLNAVADTDTYGLYNISMSSDVKGGITRSGSSGSYSYTPKTGYESMPVVFVSFYDAARFANWMENGQPTGGQSFATTEAGAYTLYTSGSTTTNIGPRSSSAIWFLPTENEWYKAAYYDPSASATTNYWLYPTQSDLTPNSRLPNAGDANSGNFFRDDSSPDDFLNDGYASTGNPTFYTTTNYLTPVGSYELAESYYGTFDQGGNVSEWTETTYPGNMRVRRGGYWGNGAGSLSSTARDAYIPTQERSDTGFRLAAIPEPPALTAAACLVLVICLGRTLFARACPTAPSRARPAARSAMASAKGSPAAT